MFACVLDRCSDHIQAFDISLVPAHQFIENSGYYIRDSRAEQMLVLAKVQPDGE
jgi:hypothetical protein